MIVCMFQFLIGRLKTHLSASLPGPSFAFQFLIGRLKTFKEKNKNNYVTCFNS